MDDFIISTFEVGLQAKGAMKLLQKPNIGFECIHPSPCTIASTVKDDLLPDVSFTKCYSPYEKIVICNVVFHIARCPNGCIRYYKEYR